MSPTSTVRRHQRSPLFSLANISLTVQLWIQVFLVISVQFDLRNTLPKSGPFLLLHPVQTGCYLCVEKKNQLDVTVCFIVLVIRSKCFGQFYAHHQELESICVLLPPMECSAWLLVIGGQVQAAGCESGKRDAARLHSCSIPIPGRTNTRQDQIS